MPKLGMEPIRRASLIKATIEEIGRAGTLDITVSQISKRAGMSSALAHHYFGGREQIFLAAMRHTLALYAGEVCAAIKRAKTPRARLEAVVRTSFTGENFRREVVASWLNFYVLAQNSPDAMRLLNIYHRRLRSNLIYALRPIIGAEAPRAAERIAAMIDGVYLHASLGEVLPEGPAAATLVLSVVESEIEGVPA